MNNERQLNERLLGLFPTVKLKEVFAAKGKKESVLEEVAAKQDSVALNDFVCAYFGLTRQHVFLRKCREANPKATAGKLSGLGKSLKSVHSETESVVFKLLTLRYEVYLNDPVEIASIEFLWPVKFVVQKERVCIHMTIMEKKIASYFDAKRHPTLATRGLDDCAVLLQVEEAMGGPSSGLEVLDINKGTKALWENGRIDAMSSRWKKSKSTTSETMDQGYLLKRDHPEAYKALKNAPLLKTAFKVLSPGEDFPEHFAADPQQGELIFSTFSENQRTVENVVREVLRLN